MRVLLGLRRVELANAVGREHLGERVLDDVLREGDGEVEVVAVAGHRRQVDAELAELLAELARAVRAEVEEDRGVALGIQPRPPVDDDGLDELVRDPAVVARLHGSHGIMRVVNLVVHDRPQRALGALPALVPVHRVVPADHGGDAVYGQLRQVVHRRVRRHVAPVGEGVDPGLLGRERQQGLEVVDVGMDAAV